MTTLSFTPNLLRHVETPTMQLEGSTVREVLEVYFQAHPSVRRYVLDIAADGERLAFGSTTGSLWISEDQGNSWDTVSEHLPPVLCVRFEG